MKKEELQKYIEEHIPIVNKMDFTIENITQNMLSASAPYHEHINHRNSVFGGSITSLLTLACWGRVRVMMSEIDDNAIIVIQESNTKYLKPVLDDFTAVTEIIDEKSLAKFVKMYQKFGKARIVIKSSLTTESQEGGLAEFIGTFVVMKPTP